MRSTINACEYSCLCSDSLLACNQWSPIRPARPPRPPPRAPPPFSPPVREVTASTSVKVLLATSLLILLDSQTLITDPTA